VNSSSQKARYDLKRRLDYRFRGNDETETLRLFRELLRQALAEKH